MRISRKTYYGLRAVASLAAAGQSISAHDLSEKEHIPEEFLEKILQKLRRSGIVASTKGSEGGYSLARSPRKISAWDILEVLDGSVRTFAPPARKGALPCSIPSHCQANEVWRKLEREIKQTLSRMTIERLVNPHR